MSPSSQNWPLLPGSGEGVVLCGDHRPVYSVCVPQSCTGNCQAALWTQPKTLDLIDQESSW